MDTANTSNEQTTPTNGSETVYLPMRCQFGVQSENMIPPTQESGNLQNMGKLHFKKGKCGDGTVINFEIIHDNFSSGTSWFGCNAPDYVTVTPLDPDTPTKGSITLTNLPKTGTICISFTLYSEGGDRFDPQIIIQQ